MGDRRALRAGLSHEPPDLSAVLADVLRDQTLGRGDGDQALAHACAALPITSVERAKASPPGPLAVATPASAPDGLGHAILATDPSPMPAVLPPGARHGADAAGPS